MRTNRCVGILLAGGLARRMGGGDKVLRQAGGISLLAHVIAALRPQCEGIVLSANGDPARFAGFDVPVVADDVPGFMGPLAGILAGLEWIAARCPDAVSWEGWLSIDEHERRAGEPHGRPRIKLVKLGDLLAAARAGTPAR